MEMTLNYSGAFCELGCDELEGVNGGISAGKTFAYAFIGGVAVAFSPVVFCASAGYGIILLGTGLYSLGNVI